MSFWNHYHFTFLILNSQSWAIPISSFYFYLQPRVHDTISCAIVHSPPLVVVCWRRHAGTIARTSSIVFSIFLSIEHKLKKVSYLPLFLCSISICLAYPYLICFHLHIQLAFVSILLCYCFVLISAWVGNFHIFCYLVYYAGLVLWLSWHTSSLSHESFWNHHFGTTKYKPCYALLIFCSILRKSSIAIFFSLPLFVLDLDLVLENPFEYFAQCMYLFIYVFVCLCLGAYWDEVDQFLNE